MTSGAFGEENYVITGTIEYSYSPTKDTYYRNFVPTNIYKASADEAVGCFGKLDFYYNKETVVGEATESGDIPLTGNIQFYDKMSKKYYFAETVLLIRNEMQNKVGLVKMFQKMGDADAETLVIGLNVKFFSGSPKTEIDVDELSDDQKQLIEWGVKTMEDIIADMGGQAYGDKVSVIYVEKLSRGYANGPQKTDITLGQLSEKPTGEKVDGTTTKTASKKQLDLFSDDDEI